MSQLYPLYDELVKCVSERQEKTIDLKRICITINNIAQSQTEEETKEHYREIGALMLHHESITTGILTPIPFNGKLMSGGKGLLFHIMNLPPPLQQILAQYLEDNIA